MKLGHAVFNGICAGAAVKFLAVMGQDTLCGSRAATNSLIDLFRINLVADAINHELCVALLRMIVNKFANDLQ